MNKWAKTYKTRYLVRQDLRGTHRQNTLWHKAQHYIFGPDPKSNGSKANINKCDLVKLKSIAQRKPLKKNKPKRQPMEKKKIFANDIISNVLISKIY